MTREFNVGAPPGPDDSQRYFAASIFVGVIVPAVGELADAMYGFFGLRPARNPSRPASTPFFIPETILNGFLGGATPACIHPPRHPHSSPAPPPPQVPT